MVVSSLVLSELAELDDLVAATKALAVKESTKKGYLTHLTAYTEFCNRFELNYFPCDNLQLCRFGQYLVKYRQLKSADSIGNYMSGIRTCMALLGLTIPDPLEKQIQLFNQGLKTLMPHETKQMKPITPEILMRIYDVVDFTNLTDMVAWVATLVGFTMFLRRSNLVPEAMDKFDPTKQFCRKDFNVINPLTVMMAEVRWSKTIQFKEKILRLPILPAKNKNICPVIWIHYMFEQIPGQPDDPAFLIPQKGEKLALSANQLVARLRKWLTLIGEEAELYALHSLRRGGATFANQCDIQGEMIKLLGDWASDAWRRYCDISMEQRYDTMQAFVDGLNKHTT